MRSFSSALDEMESLGALKELALGLRLVEQIQDILPVLGFWILHLVELRQDRIDEIVEVRAGWRVDRRSMQCLPFFGEVVSLRFF